MSAWCRLTREEDGATMVEMTIAIVLLLTLTLGFVDFGYAFYQWNAASKAVQVGARLASISDPVAPEVTTAGPSSAPGDPVPANAYSFTCTGGGSCSGGTYTAANFNRIFCGDATANGDGTCAAVSGTQRPGMYHFFPRLRPTNVVISYAATGLGYQTRPGGAVPTITVSLQTLPFHFFFLSGLLGFTDINMPSMLSTVTGEDMENGPPA
jgi:Flp pilus assembly protein TadG